MIDGEPITVTTTERNTGITVKTEIINQNNFTFGERFDEQVWFTEYVRDTTDPAFTANTSYDVIFSYDDVSIKDRFSFNPPPAEQAIASGEAFAKMEEMKIQPKEIPEWIKDVFGMYYLGEINDETLINAIQYLIKVDIIRV